jgi:hypothetical protein
MLSPASLWGVTDAKYWSTVTREAGEGILFAGE